MKILSRLITFGILVFVLVGCSTARKTACGNRIVFVGERGFDFNDNEEVLLCGSEDRRDPEKRNETDGWRRVPFSQREFLVRKYLSSRGYHHVKVTFEEDHLNVDPGVRSRIFDVNFTGAPDEFFDIGYVGWRGALLQSGSLDDIEGWTLRRMHSIGYPCAKAKILANSDTQVVKVDILPGGKKLFPPITYDEILPLKSFVMRRYDAFFEGDRYDERRTDLTSSRMAQDGVVFKSYFTPECEAEPFELKHRVSVGEPRLVRFGVGASTEELGILKATWRHGRLGTNASQLFAEAYGSKIKQSGQLGFNWFFNENYPRYYLESTITAQRIRDKYQSYDDVTGASLLAKRHDFRFGTLEAKVGPALNYEKTVDGVVAGGKTFYRLETSWQVTDFPYQIYLSDPREGGQILIATSSILKNRYTTVGAHRLRVEGTKLWNFGRFDPPRYIIGIRFGLSTVLSRGEQSVLDNLPSDFRTFLGGDRNVRGFGRQEIPLNQKGALTTAYGGLEFRAPAWLPSGFDPLFFTDFGGAGSRNLQFDQRLYFSPGLGLRWQSPVGALRVTAARGWILGDEPDGNEAEHLQFFVSLGQEF